MNYELLSKSLTITLGIIGYICWFILLYNNKLKR